MAPQKPAPGGEPACREVATLSASISRRWPIPGGRHNHPAAIRPPKRCRGYAEAKPMVFCGLFPHRRGQYPDLREALNSCSSPMRRVKFEPETSSAMGSASVAASLGCLHMENRAGAGWSGNTTLPIRTAPS